MTRRRLVLQSLPGLACGLARAGQGGGPAPKVLRLASESETGFDPARVGDVRSLRITSHIFETLLEFDPLARPVKLRPRTTLAMPEASARSMQPAMSVPLSLKVTDPATGATPVTVAENVTLAP